MLSCYAFSPLHLLEPLKGGWTDFLQESLIPRISLKKPLSKGTFHHPRLLNNLKKSVTSSRKGPIPGMKPAQALTAIQTMADHSQKWHDGSSSRNIKSSSNSKGIAAIDVKFAKELISILDKECPLNEEVNSVEKVKYGEFGRSSPFSNGAKYRVGPTRYYTRIDNRPSFREKRSNLEELMSKHLEESTRRRAEIEKWKFYAKTASEVTNSSVGQCKEVYANNEAPLNNKINEPHKVSFVSDKGIHVAQEEGVPSRVLPCQLPLKELNLGSFTLPCTIRSLNFYAMEDLGASVNLIPKSMFEHLKLARLKKINMLVEMDDMTKSTPIGIVENVLVKIDKFLFLSYFVVIDMLNTRNETMILGRPFLATIHAEIDVFNKEISLGIGMTCSNEPSDKSSQFEKPNNLHNENNYDNHMQEQSNKKGRMRKSDTNTLSIHFCKLVKQICNGILKVWSICDPTIKKKHKGGGLSFLEFLLVRYREAHDNDLIWDNRPMDYLFKEWLLTKVGNVDSFDDYKWMFDLEIDQLADEYELGIGKKGHMLDDIWENCKKVQGDNTYLWHDHGLEENERQESSLDIEEYDPPQVRSLETLTRLHSSTWATKWFKRLVAYAKYNCDSYERDTSLLRVRLSRVQLLPLSFEV
ncbi:reverse transcriptase domain-containing protein [Tanacetum coccineum]